MCFPLFILSKCQIFSKHFYSKYEQKIRVLRGSANTNLVFATDFEILMSMYSKVDHIQFSYRQVTVRLFDGPIISSHLWYCFYSFVLLIKLNFQFYIQLPIIFFSFVLPMQAMTEAAIFTIGRTIGYGKIRLLADYRSRSRLLNFKRYIQSTCLICRFI